MESKIKIPEGINVKKEGHIVIVTGPKGVNEKKYNYPSIKIDSSESEVIISSKKDSRNEKRMIKTFTAHINNMIVGVTERYVCKLKICSGHFPMKVTIEGYQVVISNFLGEKVPRKANIIEGAVAKVEGDILLVEGIDKEKTMQTAANIERATRITNRDRRVFQDGIYRLK